MNRYETDEEQIEVIKSWWQKNGTALLSGVLVLVLGWSGWNYYQTNQSNAAHAASATFEILQSAMQQGTFSEVAREGLKLMDEQPESPYAVGIALLEATYHYQKQEVDQAKTHLNWVLTHSKEDGLKLIAQLRLASILVDAKDYEAANTLLNSLNSPKLKQAEKANIAFAKAQLAIAQNAPAQARTFLTEVIDNQGAESNIRNYATLMLDDLAE